MLHNAGDLGTPKSLNNAHPTAMLASPHTSSSAKVLKKQQSRVLVDQQSTDLPEVLGENDRQMARNRRHSRALSNRALVQIQKTNVSYLIT